MKQSWDDYAEAAESGPWSITKKVIIFLFLALFLIGGIGYFAGWFKETAEVTQKEFGPSALLKKYEWFKDASAQLDKKQADIQVYQARITNMEESYLGQPRKDWARDDREQYNTWQSEVSGVKAGYNTLAADYNAQMAKFNWSFANAGQLPKGADKPLPREYKPYETE
jgi:hypothetical protein